METVTVGTVTSPLEVCKDLVEKVWVLFQEKNLSHSIVIDLQKVTESTPYGTSESCVASCSTSVEEEVRFANS